MSGRYFYRFFCQIFLFFALFLGGSGAFAQKLYEFEAEGHSKMSFRYDFEKDGEEEFIEIKIKSEKSDPEVGSMGGYPLDVKISVYSCDGESMRYDCLSPKLESFCSVGIMDDGQHSDARIQIYESDSTSNLHPFDFIELLDKFTPINLDTCYCEKENGLYSWFTVKEQAPDTLAKMYPYVSYYKDLTSVPRQPISKKSVNCISKKETSSFEKDEWYYVDSTKKIYKVWRFFYGGRYGYKTGVRFYKGKTDTLVVNGDELIVHTNNHSLAIERHDSLEWVFINTTGYSTKGMGEAFDFYSIHNYSVSDRFIAISIYRPGHRFTLGGISYSLYDMKKRRLYEMNPEIFEHEYYQIENIELKRNKLILDIVGPLIQMEESDLRIIPEKAETKKKELDLVEILGE